MPIAMVNADQLNEYLGMQAKKELAILIEAIDNGGYSLTYSMKGGSGREYYPTMPALLSRINEIVPEAFKKGESQPVGALSPEEIKKYMGDN